MIVLKNSTKTVRSRRMAFEFIYKQKNRIVSQSNFIKSLIPKGITNTVVPLLCFETEGKYSNMKSKISRNSSRKFWGTNVNSSIALSHFQLMLVTTSKRVGYNSLSILVLSEKI